MTTLKNNNLEKTTKILLKQLKTQFSTKNAIIIAASKTRSYDEIRKVYKLGIINFGENYVQEAQEKHEKGAYKNCILHLIGHLQSKKAKTAAELFDVIQSIDSQKLASKLQKACHELEKILEIYIQVNIDREDQKSGIHPENVEQLISFIQSECHSLKLTGLMCIPPNNGHHKTYFKQLKQLADKFNLPNISMGMSDDYIDAIECGATHIRLGTAIFGPRETKLPTKAGE